MKKYLIRAGFDPLNGGRVDPDICIWKPYIGGNSGNLMFAYGVMNALQTEDTELGMTEKFRFSDREIAEINANYDAFILPMADAFRSNFIERLKLLTDSINKLKIPVIVVGVGLRADYEPDLSAGMPFDGDVKRFIAAVLDKSGRVGLRGEITGDYLKTLGFVPEKDYTPIGCPSLYTYGTGVRTKPVGDIRKVAINLNGYYNVGEINQFLADLPKTFPDCCLVQQIQAELRDMYIGKWWIVSMLGKTEDLQKNMLIRGKELDKMYREDRVRFFFDPISWINYLRPFDLFVGNRFHGLACAILAGVPHITIPFNARTREMIEYHHITHLTPESVSKDKTIPDYFDTLDFGSFERQQENNLNHYIDFLDSNGLEHIFTEKKGYEMGESPLERRIMERHHIQDLHEYMDIVHPLLALSPAQRMKRIVSCNMKFAKKREKLG